VKVIFPSAAAAVALVLASCATGRPPGSPAESALTVVDQDGTELIGEFKLVGLDVQAKDSCLLDGSSCGVAVPAGVYLLKFYKMRGGRVGHIQRQGATASARAAGCLLSRVKVAPGEKIVCKSNGGFDPCRRTRLHTMDCGAAVQQQWTPKDGEPTDIRDETDEEYDLPSGGKVQKPTGGG
jgi:hypothetical protein